MAFVRYVFLKIHIFTKEIRTCLKLIWILIIIRPPGHHAMKSEYSGYCFINNVAIATQYLLDKTAIQKILIVDWDIHHGQATQQMFYEDPR